MNHKIFVSYFFNLMEKITYNKNSWGLCHSKIIGSNPLGKINIDKNLSIYTHRSGWDYVLNNLIDYHNVNGVGFYGFLEDVFIWSKDYFLQEKTIPLDKEWIGFLHNPPNIPSWWSSTSASFFSVLNNIYFKKSLNKCKGIFVLSDYHKKYLNYELPDIEINVLKHPTEFTKINFSYDLFLENQDKKIVNLGWWLRKQHSFYKLKVKNNIFRKLKLLPNNDASKILSRFLYLENLIYNQSLSTEEINSVHNDFNLSNYNYDILLSKNIVFLDLYDSSANNSIIECIARCTPILINKIPAVIEYLGEDYPFYFENYEEAEEKACDLDLIKETNNYLSNTKLRDEIRIENFLRNFERSKIYQSIN